MTANQIDMPQLARDFAANLGRTGVTLDFSPASLAVIDRLIPAMRQQLPPASDPEGRKKRSQACLNVAAYAGEVLRREEGGVWVTGDDALPLLDLGAHRALVVHAIFGFMTDGRVAFFDGVADSVVSYYDQASRINASWLETAVRGHHPDLESLEREMSADAELARWLVGQSQVAVKTARTKWEVILDFTPESLQQVETVLARLHDMLKTAAPP